MAFRKILSALTGLLLLSTGAFAQNFWQTMEGTLAPSKGLRQIVPQKYLLVNIDEEALNTFLHALPNNARAAKTITLPTPDGKSMLFNIWNTPIFTPALQNKYPGINTYTAVATGNTHITAKIDYTEKGFHAMIYDADATFFIDPYSNTNDGYYIVYYKKDYSRDDNNLMHCNFDDSDAVLRVNGSPINMEQRPGAPLSIVNGTQRKRYRLALSCTGEYAHAVDGNSPTKSGVLSAMTTSMNRVNGIYEREVAVTMQFIDNEDSLIYLNPNTDPFTANNDGDNLLDENQANTAAVIGSSNYDIGHIFSTGGGGIAQLGSVCNNSYKAMGVTGSYNPVGDAYDVDYVAHEMGHQFGADHTFNANTGSCYNNGNNFEAYEPGSSSTIMGYAGICGSSDNLQQHSDDYFHAISLQDINYFITTGFWGGGGTSCGETLTGTTPVQISNLNAAYTIPYKTPFELEAPAATSTGADSISYCWEEWDLGDYKISEDQGDTFTRGPVFRSFDPAGTIRIFPQIGKVISNTLNYKGERVPVVARTLSFIVTARSLSQDGWGTFNIPDGQVSLNVINTGQPFKVTTPNTLLTWQSNTNETVTWDVAQTNTAPVNCSGVNIYLSVDGGYTYPYTLATNVPNTGTASVSLPDITSNQARIKVKGTGNVFFDISDANFKIEAGSATSNIELENNISVFPNPAQDVLHLRNGNDNKLQVALYNAIGQALWNGELQHTLDISTSQYAHGVYFLHFYDLKNNAKAVKTVIIK